VLDLSVRDLARSTGLIRWFGTGAVDPLARRVEAGQLKRLPARYFQTRDVTIRQLIEAIADGRATLEQALRNPALVRIYKLTPNVGWVIAPANDTSFARYAEGTVGAGGVALISARAPSR
jgi:hypothetical protein